MNILQKVDSFLSKEGHVIYVRPLRPDDAPLLVDIFEHMSSESRYHRFNQTLDSVSPKRVWQEAQGIAQAEARRNQGLIAFANVAKEELVPIGAARFVETEPLEAEVAISLRDDFQNKGIGTKLIRLLALQARDLGYKRLVASIRNDNPASWKIFNKLPFYVVRTPDGSFSDIIIDLEKPHQ